MRSSTLLEKEGFIIQRMCMNQNYLVFTCAHCSYSTGMQVSSLNCIVKEPVGSEIAQV